MAKPITNNKALTKEKVAKRELATLNKHEDIKRERERV